MRGGSWPVGEGRAPAEQLYANETGQARATQQTRAHTAGAHAHNLIKMPSKCIVLGKTYTNKLHRMLTQSKTCSDKRKTSEESELEMKLNIRRAQIQMQIHDLSRTLDDVENVWMAQRNYACYN